MKSKNLIDADKMAKDHEQLEAFIRGETDEPPEIMKIKDSDILETQDNVPENHPFKSMCGVALEQYIKKVRKKENP